MTFQERVKVVREEHENLFSRKNIPEERGNGYATGQSVAAIKALVNKNRKVIPRQ